MNKGCYYPRCSNFAIFHCSCDLNVLSCQKHLGGHMIIKKNHDVSQIAHILDRGIDDTVYNKSLKILKFYEKLKLSIEKETKNLINLIIKETDKLLSKINQNSSTIFKVIIDITKSIPIYIDDIRFIEEHNTDISSDYFNLNSTRSKVLKEFLNFSEFLESSPFDDDLIIYQDLSTKYLKIIDIKNLKCTDYFIQNYYCTLTSVIKDSNNIYYCCGYQDNSNYMGRGLPNHFTLNKLNMDLCTFEQIIIENASNVGKNISGICKHDNSLYFFCNYSFIYDIKEKVCRFFNTELSQLKAIEFPVVHQIIPKNSECDNPSYYGMGSAGNLLFCESQFLNRNCNSLFFSGFPPSMHNQSVFQSSYTLQSNFYPSTSSVIKNEIFITGQLIECLLKFKPKENLFEKFYSLGSNTKFIFDKFVIVSSEYLYEIEENKLLKNDSNRFTINGLALFSSFRRGSYIYFIDDKYKIFRIDKEDKSIREVIVSS